MPLNEREQQILEEIERQFREDPEFTRKASSFSRLDHANLRLPVAGVALGLVLLGTFWLDRVGTWLALGGFGLLVLSISALVQKRRASRGDLDPAGRDFLSSAKNSRWPFRR